MAFYARQDKESVSFGGKCHTSASEMPHLSGGNATLQYASSVAFGMLRCGIWGVKVCHFGRWGVAFRTFFCFGFFGDGAVSGNSIAFFGSVAANPGIFVAALSESVVVVASLLDDDVVFSLYIFFSILISSRAREASFLRITTTAQQFTPVFRTSRFRRSFLIILQMICFSLGIEIDFSLESFFPVEDEKPVFADDALRVLGMSPEQGNTSFPNKKALLTFAHERSASHKN